MTVKLDEPMVEFCFACCAPRSSVRFHSLGRMCVECRSGRVKHLPESLVKTLMASNRQR
jgi:hypothetical protein